MSSIIAAKYGGPCIKCGKKIKAGNFVNWDRGRGIWHLDEADNKKLGSSMLDPAAREIGDSCHPDTHHKEEKIMDSEEKIMGSSINNDTINVSDLIKALQGMAGEVAKPPIPKMVKKLTDKQISFCELMALGSDRADAYTSSYDISNPAFSSNAARKLLSQEKIRNKIAELRVELEGVPAGFHEDVETEVEDSNDVIKPWRGEGRGWTIRLTEKQEKFCQARANGGTIMEAFKKSGYHAINWTERRMRKKGNSLMRLQKIKARIADLASGRAPDIRVVVAGEDSHEAPRTGTGPTSETKVGTIPMPDLAELNEFVDNFVELIKAHGRLFHHAVVTRGQEEVGIPGADVRGVEEAVRRSIETLRETLEEKLL
jgi:hypothetical protein